MEITDRILRTSLHNPKYVGAVVTDFPAATLVRFRRLDGEYGTLPTSMIRGYTSEADWVRRVASYDVNDQDTDINRAVAQVAS